MPPSLSLAFPFTVPSFTVERDGKISFPPGRFLAAKNEVVVWEVTNASKQAIDVSIVDFLLKETLIDTRGTKPADHYFEWLVAKKIHFDGTTDNEVKFLYARVKQKGAHPLGDHLSYSIRIEGDFGKVDYDPDGDIKP